MFYVAAHDWAKYVFGSTERLALDRGTFVGKNARFRVADIKCIAFIGPASGIFVSVSCSLDNVDDTRQHDFTEHHVT